jgi:hypothetical protein
MRRRVAALWKVLSMRRLLLLVSAGFLISTPAFADHIGLYSESSGSSCTLSAGLTSTAAIIQKFNAGGATGVRFRLDISKAPGTAVFSFNTPFTEVGTVTDDLAIAYGSCLSGNIVIGTLVAQLANGTLSIRPASAMSDILYTDCSYVDHTATGGRASVGSNDCNPNGVDTATWGEIKSLYR